MKITNNLILSMTTIFLFVSTMEGNDTSISNLSKNELEICNNFLQTKYSDKDELKHDVNVDIRLSFTKSIPKKYLTNQFFKLIRNSDKTIIESNIFISDNIVIITPKNSLSSFSNYSVKISSKIKDFSDNYLFDQDYDLTIRFSIKNGYLVRDKIIVETIMDFRILKK